MTVMEHLHLDEMLDAAVGSQEVDATEALELNLQLVLEEVDENVVCLFYFFPSR